MEGSNTRTKRRAHKLLTVSPYLSYEITSTEDDAASIHPFITDEALVIFANVRGFEVKSVLVDNGSSTDVLYYDAFKRMGLDEMKPMLVDTPLIRFSRESMYPRAQLCFLFISELTEGPCNAWPLSWW